jgi:hypothetical protein
LFVLDSGANRSSVSPKVAKGLGNWQQSDTHVAGASGGISNVPVLADARLKFAASDVKRDLLIVDDDALSRQLQTEVSGFIGFDVLSRMKVSIDYQEGKVSFEDLR